MNDFNRNRGFGDRRGGGQYNRFNRGGRNSGGYGDRSSGPATMFPATCDECGASCEVPFRPTGERPVYCSDCFERRGEGNRKERRNDNYRDDRRSNRRPSFGETRMYSAICDSCGKECEVPFRPTGERPVYCSDCFEGENKRGGGKGGNTCDCSGSMALLNEINVKLDKILKDLGTTKFVRVPLDGVDSGAGLSESSVSKKDKKAVKKEMDNQVEPDVSLSVVPEKAVSTKKPKTTKKKVVKKSTKKKEVSVETPA